MKQKGDEVYLWVARAHIRVKQKIYKRLGECRTAGEQVEFLHSIEALCDEPLAQYPGKDDMSELKPPKAPPIKRKRKKKEEGIFGWFYD